MLDGESVEEPGEFKHFHTTKHQQEDWRKPLSADRNFPIVRPD